MTKFWKFVTILCTVTLYHQYISWATSASLSFSLAQTLFLRHTHTFSKFRLRQLYCRSTFLSGVVCISWLWENEEIGCARTAVSHLQSLLFPLLLQLLGCPVPKQSEKEAPVMATRHGNVPSSQRPISKIVYLGLQLKTDTFSLLLA